jgi:chlorophyllide a oxygenase
MAAHLRRMLRRSERRWCPFQVEVPVEHGLLMENLLDLAHAPFTHTSTFAKGWPIPDAVRFHTQRMLAGNWDPYPIDMSFEPPCMVVSMIGLKQPGQIEAGARAEECTNHLHQLHVCLPSRKGHTRLLYRMSLDFMPWLKVIPGISIFWNYIAGQVLGEDLVLVLGQQDRMQRGGDTWRLPVSYDKLAVRYRRWRNNVGESEQVPMSAYESQSMNAGALFALEEDKDDDIFCDVRFQRQERARVEHK